MKAARGASPIAGQRGAPRCPRRAGAACRRWARAEMQADLPAAVGEDVRRNGRQTCTRPAALQPASGYKPVPPGSPSTRESSRCGARRQRPAKRSAGSARPQPLPILASPARLLPCLPASPAEYSRSRFASFPRNDRPWIAGASLSEPWLYIQSLRSNREQAAAPGAAPLAGRGAGCQARWRGGAVVPGRGPDPESRELTFRSPPRAELFQFVLVVVHVVLKEMHRTVAAALRYVLEVGIRAPQLPRAGQSALQNFPVRDGVLLASAAAAAAAALFAFLVKRFGYKSRQLLHGCRGLRGSAGLGGAGWEPGCGPHASRAERTVRVRVRSLLLLFMPFNLRSHYLYTATSAQPPALPVCCNYSSRLGGGCSRDAISPPPPVRQLAFFSFHHCLASVHLGVER